MSSFPPPSPQNKEILEFASAWYTENIIDVHRTNARKFLSEKKLQINPVTVFYLARIVGGEVTPESVARALLYPRVLGTSLNTQVGTRIQQLITTLADAYGSSAQGMDIVFKDQIDGSTRYCQVKLGVNTINKDDVETIDMKFKDLIRLSKANGAGIKQEDLAVGVLVGSEAELSAHYKKVRDKYLWEVMVGRDFWKRLTGDEFMMDRLSDSFNDAVRQYMASDWLEQLIEELSSKDFVVDLVKNYIDR